MIKWEKNRAPERPRSKKLSQSAHLGHWYSFREEWQKMNESRCGLACGQCGYREEVHCPGCTGMERPFWGESCPVKSCCEEKKLAHCGLCPAFPCDLLRQFAYDKEQGDNGERIRRCQRWAEGKEA